MTQRITGTTASSDLHIEKCNHQRFKKCGDQINDFNIFHRPLPASLKYE